MPAPTTTPPAAAQEERHFAFAFELTGARNENMLCPLDSYVCRGRWEGKNLQGMLPDAHFSELPTLPGITFIINTRKREVRRFDPLILPQNAVLLKLAQKAMEKITRQVPSPERGRLWTDCDPDFVKTAVYWWWKLAGCKRAKIVGTDPNTGQPRGKWPSGLEDIRLIPGRVMGEVYSQSGAARGFIANEDLKYKPPGDEDFVRDELALDEIPDPFVDIPADPREYLDRPPPAAGYTRVTGAGASGGRSAADVLMGDPLHGGTPGAEPAYAPTL